ncbi:unnamed protein product, partial [Ectocarpus sp. 6 AP-2014]
GFGAQGKRDPWSCPHLNPIRTTITGKRYFLHTYVLVLPPTTTASRTHDNLALLRHHPGVTVCSPRLRIRRSAEQHNEDVDANTCCVSSCWVARDKRHSSCWVGTSNLPRRKTRQPNILSEAAGPGARGALKLKATSSRTGVLAGCPYARRPIWSSRHLALPPHVSLIATNKKNARLQQYGCDRLPSPQKRWVHLKSKSRDTINNPNKRDKKLAAFPNLSSRTEGHAM